MKTTGVFTIHRFEIPIQETGKPIYIIPFGDIHKYARLHSIEHWHKFLEWAHEKEGAYFIGMGDYQDLASASERNILKDGLLHDTTILTLEQIYEMFIKEFYNEISFMTDKCIGLIEGNHYSQFRDGTTSTQRLCQLLNCKYLGVSSFIRLSLRWKDTSSSVDIWAHHGKGAARTMGGSLSRVEQMSEQAEADIYLMSHDHKKSVGMKSRLRITGQNPIALSHRKQIYARCGSFLLGYVDGESSYVADGNMTPTDLGLVKIELTPRRRHQEILSIDIHASI